MDLTLTFQAINNHYGENFKENDDPLVFNNILSKIPLCMIVKWKHNGIT